MDLADNAVIFFVDSGANATIEDFQVKTVADLNDGNKYDPFFFDFTTEGVSAALVLSVESTLGSNLAVFDSYTRSKAENGDDVYNVTYWTNGALAEAPLVADAAEVGSDITSMRKGDAFEMCIRDRSAYMALQKRRMYSTISRRLASSIPRRVQSRSAFRTLKFRK